MLRRLVVSVVAVAVLVLGGFRPSAGEARESTWQTTAAGPDGLTRLIASGDVDRGRFWEALADTLTTPRAMGGPGMLSTERRRAEATASRLLSMSAVAAGDLDGDGGDDALITEYREAAALLVARRGADGSVLWSAPAPTFFVPADIDGDGRSDVVTLAITPLDEATHACVCTVLASAGASETRRTLTQTVSVLRGADGAEVWAHAFGGLDWLAEAGAAACVPRTGFCPRVAAQSEQASGVVHDVRVIPDATGDGRPELFIGTLDVQRVVVAYAAQTTGRVWDVALDVEIGAVEARSLLGVPTVIPVADMSGDRLADLVSTETVPVRGGVPLIVYAYAASGTERWHVIVPNVGDSGTGVSPIEADGDGNQDLLVANSHNPGTTTVLSGLDGHVLWSAQLGAIAAAGDIDRDGATDVLDNERADTARTRLRAVSGRDGSTIWGPLTYDGSSLVPPTDLDGDGVVDVLLFSWIGYETFTNSAVSGADGSVLWTTPASDGEYGIPQSGVPVPLGADMNGNGTHDLVQTEGMCAETCGVVSHIHDGADYAEVWSTPAEPKGPVLDAFGLDAFGDSTAELVVSRGASVEAYTPARLLWSIGGY
jgi:hypothetical protein